jgi:hypothetical protein
MVAPIAAFFVSLIGIIILFSTRYRELKTGHTYFPLFRDSMDARALALKAVLLRSRVEIERLPPILMILTRNLVREIALRFAWLLKLGEEQAQRIADIVSHKHRFERRETRSEFLKQVSEHKNGGMQGGNGSNKTDQDEIAG